MKANEIPERIWMDLEWIPHFDCKDCITENSIEYVRKDAFIEKACEWLRNNSHNYANNALGKEYLVNDFKNYIEKDKL